MASNLPESTDDLMRRLGVNQQIEQAAETLNDCAKLYGKFYSDLQCQGIPEPLAAEMTKIMFTLQVQKVFSA